MVCYMLITKRRAEANIFASSFDVQDVYQGGVCPLKGAHRGHFPRVRNPSTCA